MALVAPHSTLAALYQTQDSAWHPLAWPKRILQAPTRVLESVGQRLHGDAPLDPKAEPTYAQSAAHGAWRMAQSPLAKGLATPFAAVLLGGLAPLVTAASMGALALQVGTGANSPHKAQAMASTPQSLSQALRGTLWQYGLIGCCTELLPVYVAQLGTRWRAQTQASQLQRGAGWAMESLGYSAALACGALLTVARTGLAVTLSAAHLLLIALAASAGAVTGLGTHLMYGSPRGDDGRAVHAAQSPLAADVAAATAAP